MKKLGVFLLLIVLSFNIFAAKTVVVGSKMFTEGYVIANMISQLLKNAGFKVEEKFGLTSFPLRAAIENGQVDIYSEYTGTAWAAYFKQTKNIYDPYELFNEVAKLDYEKNKIVWINMIPFNDTYAMAVKNEFAEKSNLRTLSDLAKFVNDGNKVIFGVNPEFYERADGFFAMAKAYGMNIPKNYVKTMEAGLTYEAVSSGKIDVAMVYSTDAKLLKYNLTVLNDDKSFFPLYNPAVLVREEVLNKYPEIKEILKPLTLYLNENIIIRLNYLVDVMGMEPEIVAKNYLKGLGLIK
ncbi:glycine betaine ABC transporter substrate-binding protein [Marinitoga sp. 38H-ov]|uniref:ABC transporter substrate-binding protein n=1 Tax=Marinitoga sp. 38H-ov TaxID=1755814 RepID=UPI0013ECC334|nr:glycine betaine ABC transporter substrate-binding protein [Marinitoga sp. 38H-ov]KAF2956352.1 glycine/betaine ABC transporter substrate-binding protein [Marinitoga sp. 38H-ov]